MYLFELIFLLSSDIYPEVEMLIIVVVLFLVFLKKNYSQQWLHHFIFQPTVRHGSLLSISSPTFVIHRLFDNSHSDRYEVRYYCGFDFHFSLISNAEHHFMCQPSVCLWKKNLLRLCQFLNLVVSFSDIEWYKIFKYFVY